MKKIYIFTCALLIVIFASITFILPAKSDADVGDFNDYDSGYDSGDSWSGGSSDSSDWSGGSGSFSPADGYVLLGAFAAFTVAAIIFSIYTVRWNKKRRDTISSFPAVLSPVRDHTSIIVPAVLQVDPDFSSDKFIGWVKEVFFTLQYAWMERDWEKVRMFEKEELYKQHEMQIKQYIDSGRINVLERININQAFLQKYVRDKDYEYLTVFLQVRMTDYIKDERTGRVLKGSPDVDSHMKYLYTFMRKTGVTTKAFSADIKSAHCPNCGAPARITSAGKCSFCGSVITTGEFNWVLSNIDGVKPHTLIDDSGVIIRDGK